MAGSEEERESEMARVAAAAAVIFFSPETAAMTDSDANDEKPKYECERTYACVCVSPCGVVCVCVRARAGAIV